MTISSSQFLRNHSRAHDYRYLKSQAFHWSKMSSVTKLTNGTEEIYLELKGQIGILEGCNLPRKPPECDL